MNLPDLEAEALKLPVAERAHLAETLLESLDALSEGCRASPSVVIPRLLSPTLRARWAS